MTTIFFATDVHGSEVCWKKFINAGKFYDAQVIILGGDMTGKAIVPIIRCGGSEFRAVFLEQEFRLQGEEEEQELERLIRRRGYYPYCAAQEEMEELKANPERVAELFKRQVLETAEQWLAYADKKLEGSGIRCYVAPGNDDMFELDELFCTSKHVQLAEGKVIELDADHEMISCGWSNITPWHCYREEEEDKLLARFQAMIGQVKDVHRSVFNLHAPPYGSSLDDVPELTEDLRPKYGGNSLVPAGSQSVRKVVEEYQPILGLFGHIHEGKGATRIAHVLCINPGSMYEQGQLLGAVVKLDRDRIANYILTTG